MYILSNMIAENKFIYKRILLRLTLCFFICSAFLPSSVHAEEVHISINNIFKKIYNDDSLGYVDKGEKTYGKKKDYFYYISDLTCVRQGDSVIVSLYPKGYRYYDGRFDGETRFPTVASETIKTDSSCNFIMYDALFQLDQLKNPYKDGETANKTGKKASSYLSAYSKEVEEKKYKSSGNQTKDNKKAGSNFNVGPHIKKLNEAKKDLIDSGSKEADLRLLSATCSQAGTVRTFTINVLDKSVIVKMPSYKTGSLTSNYYCDKVITDLKLALPLYNPEENKICLIDAEDKTYSLATSCDVSGDKEQPVGLKNQGKKKEEPATEVVEKKVEQPVKTDVTTGTCQYSSTTPVSNGEWAKTGPSWWEYRVSGKPLTGWQFVNWSGGNDWFYFNSSGTMQIGLQNLPYSGTRGTFYLDTTSGAMQTGWKFVESAKSWYFFDKCTGAALTGWQELEYNGAVKWYFFNNGGAMYEDSYTPDGYYVDSSGAWDGKPKDLENATRDDGDWSCDDESGDCSYYNKNGELLSGWQKIDGEEYFFGNNGVLQNGWIKKGNDWYFYEDNTRIINDFIEDSDGKKYYIKEDGKMARGLVLTNDGNYYCFKEDGTSDYAVMQKDTICKYEQRN